MRYRSTIFAALALATGALFDVVLLKRGLDNWPLLSGLVFPCAFLLGLGVRHWGREYSDQNIPGVAGEAIRSGRVPIARLILLGMVVTHSVLVARDQRADPTSHNLLPFEYVFFGSMVAAPAFAGSILVRLILALRDQTRPETAPTSRDRSEEMAAAE